MGLSNTRPSLKPGDVSKRGLRNRSRHRLVFDTMVVHKVDMSSSDGRCKIVCTYFSAGKAHNATFQRRELWYTGYNALTKSQSVTKMPIKVSGLQPGDLSVARNTPSLPTNDGRTHCVSCSQATKFVPGFGSSGYNLCKNKSCKMYDR